MLARLDAAPLGERRALEIDAELDAKPTAKRRRRRRVVELFQRLVQRGDDITVPAAVVAEWWRAARPSPHAERGRGARGGGLYMME